ncbi:MAG: sulfite exporter TauE/SafE family protein [Candidatus Magasanikbacteria bacterium]|nr:sulfite exporter TauE/SafE family protein [Candidatus Magasanikbacteria bacterium]
MEPVAYKFSLQPALESGAGERLRERLIHLAGVRQVDVNVAKSLVRVIGHANLTAATVSEALRQAGWQAAAVAAEAVASPRALTVAIDGMTCRSCEVTIERAWGKLPGVAKVEVNAGRGVAHLTLAPGTPADTNLLQQNLAQALGATHYRVRSVAANRSVSSAPAPRSQPAHRVSFIRFLGLTALIFLLYTLLSRLGLWQSNFGTGSTMTFGAVFLVGLVAASSSCIAVTGGLLLSAAAKFNERYAGAGWSGRFTPVLLFVAGRVASYALLGGLLGVVGRVLVPSPLVTAFITLLAALYMFMMGLEMLGWAPVWLRELLPRMPKSISHRLLAVEGKNHWGTPFALGAATFFIPCGFTQALQLYALTTGSFTAAATVLLAFALGTAPALLILGFASSGLKGRAGRWFVQFSGALVVILGLWNFQNAFNIAGYPLAHLLPVGSANAEAQELSGKIISGKQVIKMSVEPTGFTPANFVVRQGTPVRWEVDGTRAAGCTSVLVSRELNIQRYLTRGPNLIEFTPPRQGRIAFSCSMGMVQGSFTVLPKSSS